MLRRVLVMMMISFMLFEGVALAVTNQTGEVLLSDMMYGGAVGGLVGAAFYAIDRKDGVDKVLTGAALGLLGGLVWGVYEIRDRRSIVEFRDNKMTLGMPRVDVFKRDDALMVKTGLLTIQY